MKPIQMVDLQTQYLEVKDEIDKGIQKVLDTSYYVGGSTVQSFSQNLASYLDVKHVIPCANGTDALQLALMSLDLEPGDEVITTSFTFVATAEVIALLGLVPKFVDINPCTFMINENLLEEAITERTKCIIPVHLFGQASNMEAIVEVAKKHDLSVIEDNAQAIGADFHFSNGSSQKLGTIGDIGCTSFFPSKNLGCYGDGGAVFTNNDLLAAKLKTIANHGSDVRYYHSVIGVNSRLDAIQAAVLDVKLRYLDSYNQRRKASADYYTMGLEGITQLTVPKEAKYSSHVYHQYTLLVKDRDELSKELKGASIPHGVYYPVPLHLQEGYKKYYERELPVTEGVAKQVVSLPMHSELTTEQQDFIINTIKKFYS